MNKFCKQLTSLSLIALRANFSNAATVEEKKDETIDVIQEVQLDNYLNEDIEVVEDDVIGDGSFPAIFVDWGFQVCAKNSNDGLKTGFLGSRFLNLSLNYNLAIPNSHFAVGVGIGYDNRTFSFEESGSEFYTLTREKKSRDTVATPAKDFLASKEEKDSEYLPKCKASRLNTHFLDLVIDIRLFVDKLYPKDSFIFSLGGKIGTLIGSNTSIKYAQDKIEKEQYVHDTLNLKDVHLGFQARASWRRFGLIYEIMLSDLFQKNRGPAIGIIQKFGISIDLL